MTRCGPKNDFPKKSGIRESGRLVQIRADSSEIGRKPYKFSEIPKTFPATAGMRNVVLEWSSIFVHRGCTRIYDASKTASQENPFSALRKWKMHFSCNEDENSEDQTC